MRPGSQGRAPKLCIVHDCTRRARAQGRTGHGSPIDPNLLRQPRARRVAPLLIDQGELRSILSNLSHELCRPLASLRAGFDLLLGESPSSITPDQRGHLFTMVSLCDDLLRLTRSYLDYAAIVQGSRRSVSARSQSGP